MPQHSSEKSPEYGVPDDRDESEQDKETYVEAE